MLLFQQLKMRPSKIRNCTNPKENEISEVEDATSHSILPNDQDFSVALRNLWNFTHYINTTFQL
jgi:hypothetical protein